MIGMRLDTLKPDVAFISWQTKSKHHRGSALAMRCSHRYDESHWRTQTFGEISDDIVTDVRPLVAIDPEDREQVERLVRVIAELANRPVAVVPVKASDQLQAALREFASPTPDRPDEPTGLGAVVEDADEVRWVRTYAGAGIGQAWERDGITDYAHYADIAAVKVLSEGVTE